MKIVRKLQPLIEKYLFKGKVIIVLGARQVGKTTLVKQLLKEHTKNGQYFNCDLLSVRQAFEKAEIAQLQRIIGDADFIVLDEAQRVKDIGMSLKIIHDHIPSLQIIATGSSSFELSNKINEPLTGRSLQFNLYPLCVSELKQCYSEIEWDAQLHHHMIYGSYPEMTTASADDVRLFLDELSTKYLYKDILAFETLRKPDLLIKLLQLLALQLGSEVSRHELAVRLQVNRQTIDRYLDLLEKVFVIFRLTPFSRNLRNEISKKEKFYFCDLGIRNSLIAQYNSLELRDDVGALWENFCILERLKLRAYQRAYGNAYYWRTFDQKEVDYLEEADGKLMGFEFKWNSRAKYKVPKVFLETYAGSTVSVIHRDNYHEFLE